MIRDLFESAVRNSMSELGKVLGMKNTRDMDLLDKKLDGLNEAYPFFNWALCEDERAFHTTDRIPLDHVETHAKMLNLKSENWVFTTATVIRPQDGSITGRIYIKADALSDNVLRNLQKEVAYDHWPDVRAA